MGMRAAVRAHIALVGLVTELVAGEAQDAELISVFLSQGVHRSEVLGGRASQRGNVEYEHLRRGAHVLRSHHGEGVCVSSLHTVLYRLALVVGHGLVDAGVGGGLVLVEVH